MKVILPTDTTHVIKFDPRFYEIGLTLTINLYDESARVNQDVTTSNFTLVNRLIHLTFTNTEFDDLSFYENGKYQIKITDVDSTEILYRGKMIATTQTPQDYTLRNNLYTT